MKLSVIVPIYNVEKFLPRCLDSLLRQGMEDGEYEVICVNDGSRDSCVQILEEYKKKHSNVFKVITQENKGLGEARNVGLKIAQGEWIGFVDPDDYVIDGGYGYLLDHFCDVSVDVVHFGYTYIFTNGKELHDFDARPYGQIICDGDGVLEYNKQALDIVWLNLYKRAFLEEYHIRFNLLFVEDILFNFDVFSHNPHLRIITANIYRYEQGNANSLMSTGSIRTIKRQLDCLLFVIDKMNHYMQEEHGDMIPAAQRNVKTCSTEYYNKLLKARFTWHEWHKALQPIKGGYIQKMEVSKESSFWGKLILYLKNWSGQSYVVYLLVSFFMNKVFTVFIRPRIIASYSRTE